MGVIAQLLYDRTRELPGIALVNCTTSHIIITVMFHKLGTMYHILLLILANYCGQTIRDISMGLTAFKKFIFLLS